jgi:hypothetical protein
MTKPEYMQEHDYVVIRRLLQDLTQGGCVVSVWDGEAWALKLSANPEEIMASLCSTDHDVLRIRRAAEPAHQLGSITLIYGNGPGEIIADYSDDPRLTELAELMAGALAIAAKQYDAPRPRKRKA